MKIENDAECPCKSGKKFGECCAPILSGAERAATAEQLMRARYSAYVTEAVDFLKASSTPDVQEEFDEEASRNWSRASTWHALEILGTERGQAGDDEGLVEFRALYTTGDQFCNHHELSKFVRVDGEWRFADGEMLPEKPEVRAEPKIGRNDPCPCGSGKKYKKCCGAKAE